jgi:hypothetical protein
MAFKPYCEQCRTWHTETEGHIHDLYKTGDDDAPDVIKDWNGEVVLALCRRCHKAEIDLVLRCQPIAQD